MSTLKRSEREPALEEAAAGLATPIANGRTPRSGETKSGLLRTGWRGASHDQTHCSWLSALGVRGPFGGSKFRPPRPLRRGGPRTIVRPLSAKAVRALRRIGA